MPGAGGGGHWAGAAGDPTRGLLFIPSVTNSRRVWLVPTHEPGERPAYGAEMQHMGVGHLPLVKPPYSSITAIDLNTDRVKENETPRVNFY